MSGKARKITSSTRIFLQPGAPRQAGIAIPATGKPCPMKTPLDAGCQPGGEAMLAEKLSEAIVAARTVAMLDNASRLTWRCLAEGLIDDKAAERLSTVIEARRMALKGKGRMNPPKAALARPRPCRSPDRARSISRRRQLAASGAVPGTLAASFTTGEVAVLTVIARECQRSGSCSWFMDRIAAVAGVCRTTARNALRLAQDLGLVTVQERRHRAWRSDSNVIRIVSREWSAWLRLGGGCKKPRTTNTDSKSSRENSKPFAVCSSHSVAERLYSGHANHRRRT